MKPLSKFCLDGDLVIFLHFLHQKKAPGQKRIKQLLGTATFGWACLHTNYYTSLIHGSSIIILYFLIDHCRLPLCVCVGLQYSRIPYWSSHVGANYQIFNFRVLDYKLSTFRELVRLFYPILLVFPSLSLTWLKRNWRGNVMHHCQSAKRQKTLSGMSPLLLLQTDRPQV